MIQKYNYTEECSLACANGQVDEDKYSSGQYIIDIANETLERSYKLTEYAKERLGPLCRVLPDDKVIDSEPNSMPKYFAELYYTLTNIQKQMATINEIIDRVDL